jgi:hypothetical protein
LSIVIFVAASMNWNGRQNKVSAKSEFRQGQPELQWLMLGSGP